MGPVCLLRDVRSPQVMDLIANGPIKSGIRRERCAGLFDYFQNWKFARLKAEKEKKTLPKFQPPKPKVVDGLRILRKVCNTTFTREDYKVRLSRTPPHLCFPLPLPLPLPLLLRSQCASVS